MSRDNRVLQCKGKNIFQYTKIQLNIYKMKYKDFGVIGMFEVMLRNAIYTHYSHKFNDNCWLENQACIGKLFEENLIHNNLNH